MSKIVKYKKEILAIAIVLILLISLSYAYFTLTLNGTKNVVLKTSTLSVTLDDSTASGINLDNAEPLSEEDGLKTTAYTFTITNNGTLVSDYSIYLDDTDLETGETRIDDSAIRYELIKNSTSLPSALLSSAGTNPNRILNSGIITVGKTDTYTLRVWVDYDAGNDEQGKVLRTKLRVVAGQVNSMKASDILFNANYLGHNGAINTTDTDETFITGTNPNNYVWYSGKLWRAVAKNTTDNSVKLVTQWDISAVPYNANGNPAFSGSYEEQWLNDTGSDGFLGTLYNYNNYIKTDSSWNATLDATALGSITKPANTTLVTDAVGLLNMYEYQMSYTGATYGTGYLNNTLGWWTLTPYSASYLCLIYNGSADSNGPSIALGARPSINLKSNVIISGGSGIETDPYTLEGDTSAATNDLLNTRKSGEYVTFDGGSYRIVDVEDSTTQLVSSEPLKVSGNFTTHVFDTSSLVVYTPTSSTNIGYYLNNDWYNNISSTYQAMIVDGTWYLGTVGDANYSLSKCTTAGINCTKNATSVTAKVGLLRLGEELSGQFNIGFSADSSLTGLTTNYWLLTPYYASNVRNVNNGGDANGYSSTFAGGVRPSINIKSDVKITGGLGTKQSPYTISE
jgi:hypothetical protein